MYYRHEHCWEFRLGCLTRRCSKEWARSSTTGPARPRRCRLRMRRLRISGPMPLRRKRPGNWIFGEISPRGGIPPTGRIWLRSRHTTTFWCRFWRRYRNLYRYSHDRAVDCNRSDNIRRQERRLSIAKAKFLGGGTSKLDVFQATNVLEQTRASIPQLTIQLQQGENALCVLLAFRRGRWGCCFPVRWAGYHRRLARSLSVSRPTCCAADRTFAPLNLPLWHRAHRLASPLPNSIRQSASQARSVARPVPPTVIPSATS